MNRQSLSERPFGNTLIVGAGPAAIQTAVLMAGSWCERIGMANRTGLHTVKLRQALVQTGYRITASIQGDSFRHLPGEAHLSRFYEGLDDIEDCWHTIVVCTPSDTYKEVIRALNPERLLTARTIVLISPGFGSNLLVQSVLNQSKSRVEVVSLSTYYAATKFAPGDVSLVSCFTKALKKRIYIASSFYNNGVIEHIKDFFESLGVRCTSVGPLEAESRSITAYVHPPLFLNDFALNEIFSEIKSKKSMYKLYPEGPITQHTVRSMVRLWKEISALLVRLGATPVNLLQFLNDDNAIVRKNGDGSAACVCGFAAAGETV